jgi:hypothetical protein
VLLDAYVTALAVSKRFSKRLKRFLIADMQMHLVFLQLMRIIFTSCTAAVQPVQQTVTVRTMRAGELGSKRSEEMTGQDRQHPMTTIVHAQKVTSVHSNIQTVDGELFVRRRAALVHRCSFDRELGRLIVLDSIHCMAKRTSMNGTACRIPL